MNIQNWLIIVLIICIAVGIVVYTITINTKDKKDFTSFLNNNYSKMDDGDSESNDS